MLMKNVVVIISEVNPGTAGDAADHRVYGTTHEISGPTLYNSNILGTPEEVAEEMKRRTDRLNHTVDDDQHHEEIVTTLLPIFMQTLPFSVALVVVKVCVVFAGSF